jgi:hypothetical protein
VHRSQQNDRQITLVHHCTQVLKPTAILLVREWQIDFFAVLASEGFRSFTLIQCHVLHRQPGRKITPGI